MKNNYENITRTFLSKRTYTIIRLDGKAFHTFTKGFDRPWDDNFMDVMDNVMKHLCENIQGAKFGYVQSDEISIVMTDFDELETDAWFKGNIQKIVSVAASMATYAFMASLAQLNVDVSKFMKNNQLKAPIFDARTFTIASKTEVINSFVWRQKDAIRNSIQSFGQSMFSQKQLHGLNTANIIELCNSRKNKDWEKLDLKYRMGRAYYLKVKHVMSADSFDQDVYTEREWKFEDQLPSFSKEWSFIDKILPTLK